MERKRIKYYFLFGSCIAMLIACLCTFLLDSNVMTQIASKNQFESIYANTSIDYIIPAPTFEQITEIESDTSTGINYITPFYETTSNTTVDGHIVSGNILLFPMAERMNYTPYNGSRIIKGDNNIVAGSAIIDERFAEKNNCGLNGTVIIKIADADYLFTITAIAENNTYYDGTIALVLNSQDATVLQEQGIQLSKAYVSAANIATAKDYLFTYYKPLSRLKARSAFIDDNAYQQHVNDFNSADWSKEITDCQRNYESLSIRYINVSSSVIIYACVHALITLMAIIIFNVYMLHNQDVVNSIKMFITRHGGTIEEIRSFYHSGINLNMIVFIVATIVLYAVECLVHSIGLFGIQIILCFVPIAAWIIGSEIMIVISSKYVQGHYAAKVREFGNITTENNEQVQQTSDDILSSDTNTMDDDMAVPEANKQENRTHLTN